MNILLVKEAMRKMTKQEQTQEEYIGGLNKVANVALLEKYIKDINDGKKSGSSLDFNKLVSVLKTNRKDPNLFVDATPAHIEGEANRFLNDSSDELKGFFNKYGNRILDDYLGLQEEGIKKGLEGLTKELSKAKTPEQKQAMLNNLEISLYENLGHMLSKYVPSENADDEVKAIAGNLEKLNSLNKEDIETTVDRELTDRYSLEYGTKYGLHLDYNSYHEKHKQGLYRMLGKKFAKVSKEGEVKLDKKAFKAAYTNEESLKKVSSLLALKMAKE